MDCASRRVEEVYETAVSHPDRFGTHARRDE